MKCETCSEELEPAFPDREGSWLWCGTDACEPVQTGKRRGRIAAPEDVAPALAEAMAAAEDDALTGALQPGDVTILRALHARAVELSSVEIACGRDWLRELTGLGERAVRNGLRRLQRLGYHRQLTIRQVTRNDLQAWLQRRTATGSPPTLIRLADRAPKLLPKAGSGTRSTGEQKRVSPVGPSQQP